MGGHTLIIAGGLALIGALVLIARVVAGARYARARDKAWAEFGRTHPLLISRDVGPLHSEAPSTGAPVPGPGKGAGISGNRA